MLVILDFEVFLLPAMILATLTGTILLISSDWRLSLSVLALMYIGVFILVGYAWPLEMAVTKLVAGWISVSILGISHASSSKALNSAHKYFLSEVIFRISSAGLVILVALTLTPAIQAILREAAYAQVLGGLLLMGLGILHLGYTVEPLRIILGLLTFLAGFEILYATVESSVLVAGFLAVINLGLALAGAYLLLAPLMETEE
jgi:hypothetical protein